MLAKRLQKGDTIGIVAPSKRLAEEHLEYLRQATSWLEKQGFKIAEGKTITGSDRWGIAAGSPEERADDFNAMIKDDKIDAIWFYQGGQPANQMLDLIDYEAIKKHPKILMGMSDVDVLHMAIHEKTGLVTFSTADPKMGCDLHMDVPYSQKSFSDRMVQARKEIMPDSDWKVIREGKAEGPSIGCNITSIGKLAGTPYSPDFAGRILFLEDFLNPARELLWKLEQLRQMGVFASIKGLVIGYIHGLETHVEKDPQGKKILFEDMVLEATKDYDFPILKINEFGHRCKHCFLPIGARARMDTSKPEIVFTEEFLE